MRKRVIRLLVVGLVSVALVVAASSFINKFSKQEVFRVSIVGDSSLPN